jgi:hypothetical protein
VGEGASPTTDPIKTSYQIIGKVMTRHNETLLTDRYNILAVKIQNPQNMPSRISPVNPISVF